MESWQIINSLFYLICAVNLCKDISCLCLFGNGPYGPRCVYLWFSFAIFVWFLLRPTKITCDCYHLIAKLGFGFSRKTAMKVIRTFEPRHDKTNKVTVRPAKTQISLGIHPVWSESSLYAKWVAKDPSFLHGDSEDSDQTGRMPRLIWVFAGRTLILLVLSCRGSILMGDIPM